MSLKDALKEWKDIDEVQYAIGVCLGIFPADSQMSNYESVLYGGGGMLESTLYDVMVRLEMADVLERGDDGFDRYRGNPEFKVENYE